MSVAGTARAACENCGLPFYTERNDACPYCGYEDQREHDRADESNDPAEGEDTTGTTGATRAACENCELPFYAERNDACPYCGHEHSRTKGNESDDGQESASGEETASGPDDRPSRETTRAENEPRQDESRGDGDGSIVDRISNMVKGAIGRR